MSLSIAERPLVRSSHSLILGVFDPSGGAIKLGGGNSRASIIRNSEDDAVSKRRATGSQQPEKCGLDFGKRMKS